MLDAEKAILRKRIHFMRQIDSNENMLGSFLILRLKRYDYHLGLYIIQYLRSYPEIFLFLIKCCSEPHIIRWNVWF